MALFLLEASGTRMLGAADKKTDMWRFSTKAWPDATQHDCQCETHVKPAVFKELYRQSVQNCSGHPVFEGKICEEACQHIPGIVRELKTHLPLCDEMTRMKLKAELEIYLTACSVAVPNENKCAVWHLWTLAHLDEETICSMSSQGGLCPRMCPIWAWYIPKIRAEFTEYPNCVDEFGKRRIMSILASNEQTCGLLKST